MSVFHTGEVLPEDTERADGSQKQGRSILSCFVVPSPLLTLHPVCLTAFPLISIFHSSLADFLLFSIQPHTNGWKVSVPFRKSASSAPKGGAKADGQVSSSSCARPPYKVVLDWIFTVYTCKSFQYVEAMHISNLGCTS